MDVVVSWASIPRNRGMSMRVGISLAFRLGITVRGDDGSVEHVNLDLWSNTFDESLQPDRRGVFGTHLDDF